MVPNLSPENYEDKNICQKWSKQQFFLNVNILNPLFNAFPSLILSNKSTIFLETLKTRIPANVKTKSSQLKLRSTPSQVKFLTKKGSYSIFHVFIII